MLDPELGLQLVRKELEANVKQAGLTVGRDEDQWRLAVVHVFPETTEISLEYMHFREQHLLQQLFECGCSIL